MSAAFDGRASTAASTAARAHTERDVDLCARALFLWPRLDRARLTRTKGDPLLIARLVTRRSSLTFDGILAVLTKGMESRQEMNLADQSLPRERLDLNIQVQRDSTDEEHNDGRPDRP